MKWVTAAVTVLVLAAGCTGEAPTGAPVTLRVLAGSELADLAPILDDAAAATGVRVELDPVGTLDGAEAVASGAAEADHDAIWFSSNRYLALQPEAQARLGTATDIMSSPVVLGLRRSVAQRLGWVGRPVTWAEIAAAAGAGRFTYGMTDPSASNSGFSAVVAVATALVGPDRQRIADAAAALQPGGDTAIYDSLQAAYGLAARQIAADPDRFTSIVLMTDGDNTTGTDLDAFRAAVTSLPPQLRGVPVYCVLFGESSAAEMEEVARLTGGRTFDARTTPLAEVFREIRGYV